MNKIIKYIFLIAILIVFVSNETIDDYRKCGRTGVNCAPLNTCCKSKETQSGWKCWPAANAVCCSDGFHACLQGHTCQYAPKFDCIKKSLVFLENLEDTPIM